jgi:phosphohistidine phosphatase SixA
LYRRFPPGIPDPILLFPTRISATPASPGDHQSRIAPGSPTAETAQLAFGEASPANYLSLIDVLTPGEAERQTVELSQVIGSYSGSGNLVLVTHEPNISAVSFELMNHLDLLVIQPKGGSEFEELGVIRFSEKE